MFQVQSEHINDVATALAKAQAKFPAIPKSKTATVKSTKGEYSYNYADIADVLAATRPVLAAEGLAIIQAIETSDNGRIILKTMLVHGGGQYIGSTVVMRSTGGPQDLGSELTYMRRFSAVSLLGVAAEEDDDGARSQEASPAAKQKPWQPPAQNKPTAPLTPPKPLGQAPAPQQAAPAVKHEDWVFPEGSALQGTRLVMMETKALEDYCNGLNTSLRQTGVSPADLTGSNLDVYNRANGELLSRRAAAAKAKAAAEMQTPVVRTDSADPGAFENFRAGF